MKKVYSFHKWINKDKEHVFAFLCHPDVPPDRNGPERAIRNLKVKLKIFDQFKAQRGAEIYTIIRFVTNMCIKNSQNILYAFQTIAKLQPE